MLKYSIDYFSHKWIGREQPIFSYLDISFYSISMSQNIKEIILYLTLTYITLYWLVQLIVFLYINELPNLAQNIKKGVFMVTKYIFFVPFFGTILRYSSFNIVFSLFKVTPTEQVMKILQPY